MIRKIRKVALAVTPWFSIGGTVVFVPAAATAQQSPRGTLPETPALGVINGRPSLGSAPGALEPSAFAPPEGGSIGGRARGGLGRIPRKLIKANQGPPATTLSRGSGAMSLPSALPDERPTSIPDGGASLDQHLLIEDEGPADGLTLDAAIERMLAANLDLIALKFEIPQADADILTAGLRANPLIYFDSQLIPYGQYNASRPVGPTEYDIIITQPVDVSHKRKARVKVARAAKSALEAQFQDVIRRQIGNLYRAFLDLQSARVNVLSSEAAVREHQRIVDRARQRRKADDDFGRLSTQLAKAKDALNDARDALDDAREAIALLMNLSPDETSRIQPRGTLRDLAPPAPPLDELTRVAISSRPDLLALRRGLGRAESEVDLARANRLDDVFLFYDPFSYQDNRNSHTPSGRSWAVGITIPVPLYNRNQGNIARARSNATQSQVELAALERRVISEVRLAEREYRNSKQVLARIETTTLPNAQLARAKVAASFAQGSISVNDFIDHLDDDDDVARLHRDALIRHRRSMLDLNTAVGARILP
ncbi:MAG: czcC 4 [Planctomycetota bacterium]|nr:czcC 4 [Planctomycetota bacterium]